MPAYGHESIVQLKTGLLSLGKHQKYTIISNIKISTAIVEKLWKREKYVLI